MDPFNPMIAAMSSTLQNATDVIAELQYKTYKYNRDRAPDIDPQSWSLIFLNAEALEARYQKERSGA